MRKSHEQIPGFFMQRARPAGLGVFAFVTPDDVLAYRNTWDAYVAASLSSMRSCADAIDTVLKDKPAGGVYDVYRRAAEEIHKEAGHEGQNDGTLQKAWNEFQGLTDEQIVAGASYILRGHQETVLAVNRARNFSIDFGCLSGWPHPPSVSLQAQVIGRIEGLRILARGALGIMQESAVRTVDLIGQQVTNAWDVAKSPWTWVGVGVVGATILGVVYAPQIKAAIEARRRSK
jgi:hypothetical protein